MLAAFPEVLECPNTQAVTSSPCASGIDWQIGAGQNQNDVPFIMNSTCGM